MLLEGSLSRHLVQARTQCGMANQDADPGVCPLRALPPHAPCTASCSRESVRRRRPHRKWPSPFCIPAFHLLFTITHTFPTCTSKYHLPEIIHHTFPLSIYPHARIAGLRPEPRHGPLRRKHRQIIGAYCPSKTLHSSRWLARRFLLIKRTLSNRERKW